MTALSACCAFGGGYESGTKLLMESSSPVRCAVSSNSSNINVFCECSDVTQRYDIITSSCISSCASGERWAYVKSDAYGNIKSIVGRCMPCLAGTYSVSSTNDEWVDTCLNCTTGTYISSNGSSACRLGDTGKFAEIGGLSECDACVAGKYSKSAKGSTKCDPLPAGQFGAGASCPINTYSEGGAAECTKCSAGKYAEIGASQCIKCGHMYRLSTHCDFPVSGMLFLVSTILIFAVAYLLFRRYKKKQDRIKEKLRVDLYRQRQLVKTKQTDINLMTGTTSFSVICSRSHPLHYPQINHNFCKQVHGNYLRRK